MSNTPFTDSALQRFVFKDEAGEPLEFVPGQREIMEMILTRRTPGGGKRAHVMTTTQYGKSTAVGAALSVRAATKGEKWAIVAGTGEKARIIMDYVILFSTQDPTLAQELDFSDLSQVERLRKKRSQDRLNFKEGGEIRVYSGDVKNKQAAGEALMGFGAPNLIEDESALVPDDIHAKAMRMLGGRTDNFLMKIGNPFNRNHFLKSYENPNYFQLVVDYHRAIREGRLTPEYIKEMQNEAFFDVFYECRFPGEDMVDPGGWLPLLTDTDIENAMVENGSMYGDKRLGCDVAGGGRNFSVVVARGQNYARKLLKKSIPDTMKFATKIVDLKIEERVANANVFIDKVGIGRGAYDRVNQLINTEFNPQPLAIGVNAGDPAQNPLDYMNSRAEMYWRVRDWIKSGGQLELDEDWYQLSKIKYRATLEGGRGKVQIMPKELMLKAGIESPDVADALAMTFARPSNVATTGNGSGVYVENPISDPYAHANNNGSQTPIVDPYAQ
jgi:hypothetical protein